MTYGLHYHSGYLVGALGSAQAINTHATFFGTPIPVDYRHRWALVTVSSDQAWTFTPLIAKGNQAIPVAPTAVTGCISVDCVGTISGSANSTGPLDSFYIPILAADYFCCTVYNAAGVTSNVIVTATFTDCEHAERGGNQVVTVSNPASITIGSFNCKNTSDGGTTFAYAAGDASGDAFVKSLPDATSASATTPFFPASGSIVAGNVKASAGNLFGLYAVNQVAAVTWLQFFNTAGVPVLGTSVIFSLPIPAGVGSVLAIPSGAFALANFATGIGWGAATTIAGAAAPVSAPTGMCFYK